MQVSVENTSDLGRLMTVKLPPDDFEAQVRAKINEAARGLRLPGFRPGKVPHREIQRRFGKGIRAEVAEEVMRNAFFSAVQEASLQPAGYPRLRHLEDDVEQFAFTAEFEVLPSVTLADLSDVTVQQPVAEVVDGDIDEMVERLREQNKQFEVREGAAEDGDQLLIDFVGRRDGEPFEGGTAEGVELTLGSGQFIPGFETGLQGVTAAESRTLEITFPEDYQEKSLAGQPATFDVTVREVRAAQLPALDGEFFRRFDIDTDDVADFRAQVRENMTRELNNRIRGVVRDRVMEVLLERHEVPAPTALVAVETEQMRSEQLQRFGGRIDEQQARQLLPDELFRENAERRVRLGLIVRAYVEQHDITPSDERVRERLEQMASAYDQPEAFVEYHLQDPERLEPIRSAVLEDMVVEHVMTNATVEDVPSSYTEIVKPVEAPPAVQERVADAPTEPVEADADAADSADASATTGEAAQEEK